MNINQKIIKIIEKVWTYSYKTQTWEYEYELEYV